MALENGGLDAQVEQRMDAYRSNPQQLQQRYGQNKELLDLLALQKLTSEKQAAARDMQMKMQQQPGTIAQQREQEALELTKQEMGSTLGELAGRTKGTLDQKQAMQQQNMQKMAQGQPPVAQGGIGALMGGQQARPPMPPQGGPQAAGLPNARMMQAARGGPVRRMAQGGIVSFAGGEEVKAGEAVRKRIAELGIDAKQFAAMPEAQRKNILDSINDRAALGQFGSGTKNIPAALYDLLLANPLAGLKNIGTDIAESRLGTALGFSDPTAAASERAPMFPTLSGVQNEIAANQAGLDETGLKSLLPPGVEAIATPPPITTPPPVLAAPPVASPSVSTTSVKYNPEVEAGAEAPPALSTSTGEGTPQVGGGIDMNKLMGNMGFDTENADSAMQRGFETADAYTGRAEKNAKYDEMLAEISAFDAENYDPKREKADRLKAFLIGAGGKTNIGATFGGAGAASMNMGNAQRKDRRTRLMDKFEMEKSKMGVDAAMAQSGMALGKELYSQAMGNQRAALGAGVAMRGQSLQAAQADADRIIRKIEGDNTQSYRAATLAVDQAKLNAKIVNDENATETARINAANDTVFRTLQVREQMLLEANAAAGVDTKKAIYESAELMGMDETEVAAALADYEKAAAAALVISEDMMNRFGRGVDADGNPTGSSLLDAEQMAIEALARLGVSNRLSEDDLTSVTTRD